MLRPLPPLSFASCRLPSLSQKRGTAPVVRPQQTAHAVHPYGGAVALSSEIAMPPAGRRSAISPLSGKALSPKAKQAIVSTVPVLIVPAPHLLVRPGAHRPRHPHPARGLPDTPGTFSHSSQRPFAYQALLLLCHPNHPTQNHMPILTTPTSPTQSPSSCQPVPEAGILKKEMRSDAISGAGAHIPQLSVERWVTTPNRKQPVQTIPSSAFRKALLKPRSVVPDGGI
ncbi:hypothetical protein SAMN05880582_103112 [Rhizobium sp. RU20A]|nr:hypothetical protein SAMN05880582_103112 [Rhizobium sp. RU20A]